MSIKDNLNKIARIFQPAYQKIDDWDLPWLRIALKDLWELLDNDLKKALYVLIMALYAKYGEAKAKEIVKELKDKLGE